MCVCLCSCVCLCVCVCVCVWLRTHRGLHKYKDIRGFHLCIFFNEDEVMINKIQTKTEVMSSLNELCSSLTLTHQYYRRLLKSTHQRPTHPQTHTRTDIWIIVQKCVLCRLNIHHSNTEFVNVCTCVCMCVRVYVCACMLSLTHRSPWALSSRLFLSLSRSSTSRNRKKTSLHSGWVSNSLFPRQP